MTVALFLDTFTGADGTNLTSHTPDVGSGWLVNQAASTAVKISGNKAVLQAAGGAGNAYRCRTFVGAEDQFRLSYSYTRRSLDAGDDEWRLEFLSRTAIANPNGDRCYVQIQRATNATVNIKIVRITSAGAVAQSSQIGTGVAWALGQTRKVEVRYDTLTPSVYLDDVLVGSLLLTADLRDGSHGYAAAYFYIATESGVQPDMEDFTLTIDADAPEWVRPKDGAFADEQMLLKWTAPTLPSGVTSEFEGEYSDDDGDNWTPIFAAQEENSYLWETFELPAGPYLLRFRPIYNGIANGAWVELAA